MATHHVTHIDGAAHGVYDDLTKKITLSPGSILTINLNKRPPANIAQNYRDVARHVKSGDIKVIAGQLRVVRLIPNLSPSAARVFVDGKVGSGRHAWVLRNGSSLATVQAKKARTSSAGGLGGGTGSSPAARISSGGVSASKPYASGASGTPSVKPPAIPPPAIPPPATPPPALPAGIAPGGADFAEALVKWIQYDPYHPPMGRPPVIGWDQRINTYAYATRANPVAWPAVYLHVGPMISGLAGIIRSYTWSAVGSVAHLTPTDNTALKRLAKKVCEWGGVRQKRGYADAWKVIKSAVLGAQYHGAPMNSGWTKVASFATDGAANSQTIWDSRVATSLIWRLDRILHASSLTPPSVLTHYAIGYVPGRAYRPGSLRHRTYNYHWPSGYRKWSCHLAGGQLVRDMVKVLNDPAKGYPRMPTPAGGTAPWDVFGVGLVLFMDGR